MTASLRRCGVSQRGVTHARAVVAVAFVALVAATACGGVEHGVAVERVEAPPVGAMAVQPSLVAAGRSLVAVRGTQYERPEELAFSTDFGAHWRHVELPGAPDGDLAFATPMTLGDFVVVTARDHGEFGIPGSFVPHGRAFV